jgi:hypothetical protein
MIKPVVEKQPVFLLAGYFLIRLFVMFYILVHITKHWHYLMINSAKYRSFWPVNFKIIRQKYKIVFFFID